MRYLAHSARGAEHLETLPVPVHSRSAAPRSWAQMQVQARRRWAAARRPRRPGPRAPRRPGSRRTRPGRSRAGSSCRRAPRRAAGALRTRRQPCGRAGAAAHRRAPARRGGRARRAGWGMAVKGPGASLYRMRSSHLPLTTASSSHPPYMARQQLASSYWACAGSV